MSILIAEMIRSRWAHGLALVVVVLSLVLPDDGVRGLSGKPLQLCYFVTATGKPCPGCGLTRSFIHLAHLRAERSVSFHPAGLVLFPFTVYLSALLLVSPGRRERMAVAVMRRGLPVNVVSILLGVAFFAYGIWRIVWLIQTRQAWP